MNMLRISDHQSLLHLTLWLLCTGPTAYVSRFQYSSQMCITPMQAQVRMLGISYVVSYVVSYVASCVEFHHLGWFRCQPVFAGYYLSHSTWAWQLAFELRMCICYMLAEQLRPLFIPIHFNEKSDDNTVSCTLERHINLMVAIATCQT